MVDISVIVPAYNAEKYIKTCVTEDSFTLTTIDNLKNKTFIIDNLK